MDKLLFFLLILLYTSKQQIPNYFSRIFKLLSPECSFHGYLYKGVCYCETMYKGSKCESKQSSDIYDADEVCDDLLSRLDVLNNISPSNYLDDDDEFSRFDSKTIGENDVIYGHIENSWIKMHDCANNFEIFKQNISVNDIKQGKLGDCYLLAAFSALANIDQGYYIKNAFETKEDNANHIYTTRWFFYGKLRYVSVDEWIPGRNNYPFFSRVAEDKYFWPIILEKAWAKLHGSYGAIQNGWQPEVWKALLSAPVFELWHEEKTGEEIWGIIKGLTDKGFAVGTSTNLSPKTNEVSEHTYAVLGAFEVILDDGSTQKLILYHNPWGMDYWKNNPWGDGSPNWTPNVIAQVPAYYNNTNDGLTFVTPEDYLQNFGLTNWVEVQRDYEVIWVDVAYKSNKENYSIDFNISSMGKDVYFFVDQPSVRQNMGCRMPFVAYDMYVEDSKGNVYKGFGSVKIPNAEKGSYKFNLKVSSKKEWVKFFTVSSYCPENSVAFEEIQDNVIDFNYKKCPNDCNGQGRCNTYKGECKCYHSFSGQDCSLRR